MDLRRHGASSKLLIASPSVSRGATSNEEEGAKSVVGTEKVAEPDLDRQVVDCCYADDDGGRDGYRTPTSPSSRIPELLSCPPAPRKSKPSSSSPSLRLKRRKRNNGAEAEAEGSGSFASSRPELEFLAPESKKARKMLQRKSVNIEEDDDAAAVFELHK